MYFLKLVSIGPSEKKIHNLSPNSKKGVFVKHPYVQSLFKSSIIPAYLLFNVVPSCGLDSEVNYFTLYQETLHCSLERKIKQRRHWLTAVGHNTVTLWSTLLPVEVVISRVEEAV